MKFFVTGVGGQLGHDVMNELLKRGHEGVGSDIQPVYSGVEDGSAVTSAPYVALDITDKASVERVITEVNPDAVIHCAAWTAVDMAWNDPEIGIEWPQLKGEYQGTASAEGYALEDGTALILSEKDQKWLGLKDTFKF